MRIIPIKKSVRLNLKKSKKFKEKTRNYNQQINKIPKKDLIFAHRFCSHNGPFSLMWEQKGPILTTTLNLGTPTFI